MKITKLCDVMEYEQPSKYIVKSEQYSNDYNIPVITAGKSFILGYTNEIEGIYNATKDNPIILFDDFTTDCRYIDFKFKVKSSAVKILKLKRNDNNLKYLYYVLKNIVYDTSSHKRYWISQYSNFKIKLPSMEIQNKIVGEIEKIEELIENKKNQIQKIDELIMSQFVAMFGDPILNEKGWQTSTIGECCSLKSGNSLPAEVENEGGEILYIKVGDMNLIENEKYITTSTHTVTEKTAGKGIFKLGTVLFPKRGGAIGTNKKRLTISRVCADLNVMGVTPNSLLNSEYLYAYFLFIDLSSLNNGSSIPQINNKDISPLVIQIPPIELQNKFAEFVKHVYLERELCAKMIEKLNELRNLKMQEYFGGVINE